MLSKVYYYNNHLVSCICLLHLNFVAVIFNEPCPFVNIINGSGSHTPWSLLCFYYAVKQIHVHVHCKSIWSLWCKRFKPHFFDIYLRFGACSYTVHCKSLPIFIFVVVHTVGVVRVCVFMEFLSFRKKSVNTGDQRTCLWRVKTCQNHVLSLRRLIFLVCT